MKRLSTLALFSLTCLSPSLFATGIEQGYQDATAAARGNAIGASVESSAGIYYNPAGLAHVDRAEVQFTTLATFPDTRYSGIAGRTATNHDFGSTGSLFSAIPVESLGGVLGLGLTTPHGLSIEYPEDGPLRSLAIEGELAHAVFTATYSTKLSDSVSVGVGLSYAYNDIHTRQGLALPGDFIDLDFTGSGWGYTAGIQYRPNEQHYFGLTYQSQIAVGLKGDIAVRSFLDPFGNPLPAPAEFSGTGTSSIRYPDKIIAGYAWNPSEKTQVEINATWTNWEHLDQINVQTALPVPSLSTPYNHNANWVIGLGISHELNDAWTLHGGYLYGEAVVPDSTFTPFIADSDLHVFSVGSTYTRGDWELSGTFLIGVREDRDVVGSPASPLGVNADGRWETVGRSFLATVKRQF